jgi:hypothetical protein
MSRPKCVRIMHLPVSWFRRGNRRAKLTQFPSELGIGPCQKNCEKFEAKVYTDHTLTSELVLIET